MRRDERRLRCEETRSGGYGRRLGATAMGGKEQQQWRPEEMSRSERSVNRVRESAAVRGIFCFRVSSFQFIFEITKISLSKITHLCCQPVIRLTKSERE
ncbi:hypothetical protein ACOSQ4_029082 [Xanthoceras sorbifolium]